MIKQGDTLNTANFAEVTVVEIDSNHPNDTCVQLWINPDQGFFWAEDIKELRKFLKKLQKQLEPDTQEA